MEIVSTLRDLTVQLYDTKTRPGLVAKGLVSIGAEKYLDPKQIDLVASLTTVQALVEKGSELKPLAASLAAKAKNADGRAELVVLANDKIFKPTREVAAPYVQPYVSSANEKIVKPTIELAAPYVAKLESSRAAIMGSPRYKKVLESLQHVREHPLGVAQELKSQAIDLIKYDDLVSYRAYVQSAEFQAETLKLVCEDLPKIARDAALRGLAVVQAKAIALSDEVKAKREVLMEAWKRGFELGRSLDLDDIRGRARTLVADIQAMMTHAMAGDYTDIIAKLTKIFRLDKFFPSDAPAAAPAAAPCE